jgi:hypothetical protein
VKPAGRSGAEATDPGPSGTGNCVVSVLIAGPFQR